MAKEKTLSEIHEENKREAVPAKDVKYETLVSGAEYWDFDKINQFEGIYRKPVLREKDGTGENQKAGSVIGYMFEDEEGNDHIIGNSHAIAKAIDMCKPGDILLITFEGKTVNSKGQQVNKFKVQRAIS